MMLIECKACGTEVEAKSTNKLYCTPCSVARTNRSKEAWEARSRAKSKGRHQRIASVKESEAWEGRSMRTYWDELMDRFRGRRTEKEYKEVVRISRLPLTDEAFGA